MPVRPPSRILILLMIVLLSACAQTPEREPLARDALSKDAGTEGTPVEFPSSHPRGRNILYCHKTWLQLAVEMAWPEIEPAEEDE